MAGALTSVRRRTGGLIGLVLTSIFILMAALGPVLAPCPAGKTDYAASLRPPDGRHLMGTDPLGRDLFSRLLCGARTTIGLALIISLLNAVLAVTLGALAGFRGGGIEIAVMRLADAVSALPGFLLALCFIGIFGGGPFNLVLFLVVTGWAALARVVKNEVSIVKNSDYITANAAAGYSRARNLFRHALPAVLPSLFILFVISLIGDVFAIVSMSFLGLGLSPSIPEWGMILSDAREFLPAAPWLFVFPSVFIGLFALGLHLAADGLRDRFDGKKQLVAAGEIQGFSRGGSRFEEIDQ